MSRNKENALQDFARLIYSSWTFQRMTPEEQKRLDVLLFDSVPVRAAIVGTYDQRIKILHGIYDAYLSGLGYDGFNWREPAPAPDLKEQARRDREAYLRKLSVPQNFDIARRL